MAESTLTLTYNDLAAEVGSFLGYGQGNTPPYTDPAWNSFQQGRIDSCVRSGIRQFLVPPAVDGASSYDWSFLRPVGSVVLPLGGQTVGLPDDFGSPEGQVSVLSATGQVQWPLDFVHEGTIRQMYAQSPTASGRPIKVALQPLKGTSATQGQRFQLIVFPLADQQYTLQFAYYYHPDFITNALPYTLGGMGHSETILESCLSIAEERLDDASEVHAAKFKERLLASINMDRRLKPQLMGYNGDRSDKRTVERRDLHWLSTVKYSGVQY